MAFLLGSFTNGLFGGAGDVFSLYQKFQQIQQTRKFMQAGDEVQRQMEGSPSGGGNLPPVQDMSPSPSSSAAATTNTSSFDDDPELQNLPDPYSGPREGRSFPHRRALRSTRGNVVDYDKDTSTAPAASSSMSNIENDPYLSPATAPASALPQPREASPSYLPMAQPGTMQPPGTTFALPPAPQSVLRPPMAPTLASGQSGLGAQILAALNPTAGYTV